MERRRTRRGDVAPALLDHPPARAERGARGAHDREELAEVVTAMTVVAESEPAKRSIKEWLMAIMDEGLIERSWPFQKGLARGEARGEARGRDEGWRRWRIRSAASSPMPSAQRCASASRRSAPTASATSRSTSTPPPSPHGSPTPPRAERPHPRSTRTAPSRAASVTRSPRRSSPRSTASASGASTSLAMALRIGRAPSDAS